MDRQASEATSAVDDLRQHLTRVLPPEALLAGTGLKPQDLNDLERRISARQALQYIDNRAGCLPNMARC
jgi:hypothetical protein